MHITYAGLLAEKFSVGVRCSRWEEASRQEAKISSQLTSEECKDIAQIHVCVCTQTKDVRYTKGFQWIKAIVVQLRSELDAGEQPNLQVEQPVSGET